MESVGDPGKESNASWVIARGAHKKPTYAQMVKASNQVVSKVRKRTSNRVISEVSTLSSTGNRILSSTGNRSHTRKYERDVIIDKAASEINVSLF